MTGLPCNTVHKWLHGEVDVPAKHLLHKGHEMLPAAHTRDFEALGDEVAATREGRH